MLTRVALGALERDAVHADRELGLAHAVQSITISHGIKAGVCGSSTAVLPHADAMRLEDPDAAAQGLPLDVWESREDGGAHATDVLVAQADHQDAWRLRNTLPTDVGEIEVERDKDAVLRSAGFRFSSSLKRITPIREAAAAARGRGPRRMR